MTQAHEYCLPPVTDARARSLRIVPSSRWEAGCVTQRPRPAWRRCGEVDGSGSRGPAVSRGPCPLCARASCALSRGHFCSPRLTLCTQRWPHVHRAQLPRFAWGRPGFSAGSPGSRQSTQALAPGTVGHPEQGLRTTESSTSKTCLNAGDPQNRPVYQK